MSTTPPGEWRAGLPPAAWHPDPTRRHEWRYWDGARWTEHVSDGGRVSQDPLPSSAPTRQVEPIAWTAATDAAGFGTTASRPSTGVPTATSMGAPTGASTVSPTVGPPPSVPTSRIDMHPAYSGFAPVASTGAPPARMRSIGGLATALAVVLWVTAAVAAFSAFASFNRVAVANDVLDATDLSFPEILDLQQRADDADNLVSAAVVLMLACSITVFVLLVIWMWRVAKNAELAGRTNPRFSPGWTIGGWFIPLANLVIPVLVMQDLWRGSRPETPRGDPSWRRQSGSALVGWWWAAFVLSSLRIFGGGEATTRDDVETLRTTDAIAGCSSIVAIAAAVLLILVVRGITQRQRALLTGTATTPG